MVRKILISILLIWSSISMAEPVKNTVCPPTSAADIRMGTVGNDIWTYWWCRNSTDVWATWNTWLESEWKSHINFTSSVWTVNKGGPYIYLSKWGGPIPKNEQDVPIGREHLWQAAYAAILADTGKPQPGTPNFQPTRLPELWIVTPNGANPKRKTSKVIDGVVQAYGSGTLDVNIGLPCDHNKQSYPIGTLTKYLPLVQGPADEVISCIRIQ